MTTPATAAELDRARNEVTGELSTTVSKNDAFADPWLDADTYHFSAPQDQIALLRAVTPADVQRVANRLFNKNIASVVAGESAQLKAALQGKLQYEVLGEVTPPAPKPPVPKTPAKPVSNDNPR
jgi:predicted Zn-dependent peptidase